MSLAINLSFLSKKPSGISNYAINLLPQLQQLSPKVFCEKAYHPALENFKYQSVAAGMSSDCGARGHLKRLLWTQLELPGLYRKIGANLLFSPLPEAPLFSQCRYVVTVHDLIPLRFGDRFSRLGNYFRAVVPQILAQAQHILVNSESTANDLIQFFQLPANKITVTYLAYDPNHFRYLNLARKNYFLYLGRHDRHKNLVSLIQAFATLPIEYDLYLAGSRDRRCTPELERLVKELNLVDRVKFLDYAYYSELPILLNQAIALILPSLWEGFGLPALEAMGCGTPVIVSSLGALPEVVGEAGILIDPHRIETISEAMKALIQDPNLQKDLHKRSLAQAKKFSWTKTGAETVGVLSGLL